MSRACDGDPKDAGLWCEETGNKVNIPAFCSDNDSARVDVDLLEPARVGFDATNYILIFIDKDIIPGFNISSGLSLIPFKIICGALAGLGLREGKN